MQEQTNGSQEPINLEQTVTPVTPTPVVAESVVQSTPQVAPTSVVPDTPVVAEPVVQPVAETPVVPETPIESSPVVPETVVESTPAPVAEQTPVAEMPVAPETPVMPSAPVIEPTPEMATPAAPIAPDVSVVESAPVAEPLATAPAPTTLTPATPAPTEEKKVEKKKLPIVPIVIILLVVVAAVVLFLFKDKIFKNNDTPDTPVVETDKEAVDYCIANLDTIATMIEEVQKNGFLSKYYPRDIVLTEKGQIDCNQSILNAEDSTYIIYASNQGGAKTNGFKYNKATNTLEEISLADNRNKEFSYPISYAIKIIMDDLEAFKSTKTDVQVNAYPYEAVDNTYKYDGGDIYKVAVAEYGDETTPGETHFYSYLVDFKNKTFEKEEIVSE